MFKSVVTAQFSDAELARWRDSKWVVELAQKTNRRKRERGRESQRAMWEVEIICQWGFVILISTAHADTYSH